MERIGLATLVADATSASTRFAERNPRNISTLSADSLVVQIGAIETQTRLYTSIYGNSGVPILQENLFEGSITIELLLRINLSWNCVVPLDASEF